MSWITRARGGRRRGVRAAVLAGAAALAMTVAGTGCTYAPAGGWESPSDGGGGGDTSSGRNV